MWVLGRLRTAVEEPADDDPFTSWKVGSECALNRARCGARRVISRSFRAMEPNRCRRRFTVFWPFGSETSEPTCVHSVISGPPLATHRIALRHRHLRDVLVGLRPIAGLAAQQVPVLPRRIAADDEKIRARAQPAMHDARRESRSRRRPRRRTRGPSARPASASPRRSRCRALRAPSSGSGGR